MSDDMESRLMARISDGFERVSDRLGAIEKRLDTIDLTLTTLTEPARLSNTLLIDLARRITDLEKK